MTEAEEGFKHAKEKYLELINQDFPDFDLDEYAQVKAQEIEQSDPSETDEQDKAKGWQKLGKKVFSALDVSGDGKFDLSDLKQMPETAAKNIATAAKDAGETVSEAVSSFDAAEVASDTKAAVAGIKETLTSIEASEVAASAAKVGKTAVGVQGFQNRTAAKNIQDICSDYYDAAEEYTEQKRQELNYAITSFGEYRLRTLHQTVGRFLEYLKELKQKNAVKEYEILFGAEIDTKTIDEMERIDMAASEALRTTAVSGAFGAVAVLGTPAIVTGTVAAFATASTGTAITTLGGAAANSAVLAWLGGGSLAAGGGGMAAGTVTLAALTAGATAVVTILAAGTLVSLHYGKKLSEAKEYEKDVGLAVANLEKAWIVMDGISDRTAELREVTEELRWRTASELDKLESLVSNFDFSDKESVSVFNKCALLVKTSVEIAQAPLLDNDGNLSTESLDISSKVRKVLNTEV